MAIIVKSRRDRVGVVETTADLANLFGRTGWLVVVRDTGVFEHVASGPANGTDIFAGTNGFWSRVVNSS